MIKKSLKVLTILLAFTINIMAFGQTTTINGNFKSAAGRWIRLYAIQDFVTFSDTMIAKTKIDSNGYFAINLKLPKDKIYYSYFKVNDIRSNDLYLESNKTYNLLFDNLDFDKYDTYTSFLTRLNLNFSILNLDTNDLNYKIPQLNTVINEFYAQNLKNQLEPTGGFINKIPKQKIDSLSDLLHSKFANYNNNYFKTYLKYSIAEIKLISRSFNKIDIFNEYIWNQRPIYDNVQYMSFFTNYFRDYIINSTKIKNRDLISNIEWRVNYNALLDSLGKDTILKNEVIRELVLLENIIDWYNKKLFSTDSLKKLLNQFYDNTKFKEHKIIIKNINKNLFSQNKINLSAYPLLTNKNDTIYLKQFKTKYVLLYFFTSWCSPCIKELATINEIAPNINDSVKIIAVSADRIPLNYYYFTKDYNFSNIEIYYFNQNYEILEQLNIVVFPQSILIDKNGNIINAAMPDIKNGLIEYLYNISKRK
jgi:thiol-disulfide isomerase/thioredoxin